MLSKNASTGKNIEDHAEIFPTDKSPEDFRDFSGFSHTFSREVWLPYRWQIIKQDILLNIMRILSPSVDPFNAMFKQN